MDKSLKAKDYLKIFFLYGIVYATIPIIILEITWDAIFNMIGLGDGLLRELIASFFRAALIEEAFKFFGFIKANKKYHFSNEKEFMLGAGMIGLAYGIIEKVAAGNAMAVILGIIFPMHIIWQMNQGRHFYKYKNAKDINDNKKAKRELFLATFMIFFIHGSWDALISLVGYFADNPNIANADIIGGILLIGIILFGIIYIVASIVKIRRVLKNSKMNKQLDK
ncbi:MAG: hypothetical protein IKR04_07365 [Clostridia bacterium]|nr:hypothetical protein [Clostridia bacterium]